MKVAIGSLDTAQLQKTLKPGHYTVKAGSEAATKKQASPTVLVIGKERKSASNQVAWGILARAEPKQAGQKVVKSFARGAAENLEKDIPGCALLDETVLWIFLFCVFRRRLHGQFTQPQLDHEGREVKWVFRGLEKGRGVLERWDKRERLKTAMRSLVRICHFHEADAIRFA